MVQHTLSLMLSCGMYDYSGEFAFHVRIMGKKVPFIATHTHPASQKNYFLDSWGESSTRSPAKDNRAHSLNTKT